MRTINFKRVVLFLEELPRRTFRFLWNAGAAGLHRLYVLFFAVPQLRKNGKLSDRYSIKSASRAVIVFDDKALHKIALGRLNRLQIEYVHFDEVQRNFPQLLDILPDYSIDARAYSCLLSMTRYQPLDLCRVVKYAQKIYGLMRITGLPAAQYDINCSEQLRAGLGVIRDEFGDGVSESICQLLDDFLSSGQYRVGLAHGDFHSRNVLVDKNGEPRLIDLDCVRLSGIQDIDALYFMLEMEWSKSGKLWHETIVDYLKNGITPDAQEVLSGFGVEYSKGLAMVCFVDRIGQESINYGFRYSAAHLGKVIKAALRDV